MRHKNIVFVDCDETLLYSRNHVPGSISFRYGKDTYDSYTLKRPSAEQFLYELHQKYTVMVVTQGVIGFQAQALALAGLSEYIEEIYGYENDLKTRIKAPSSSQLISSRWVLVDNCIAHEDILDDKRRWLQAEFVEGVNFLNCTPFYGVEETSLLDLVPSIKELLP
jgi:hypothetical protein